MGTCIADCLEALEVLLRVWAEYAQRKADSNVGREGAQRRSVAFEELIHVRLVFFVDFREVAKQGGLQLLLQMDTARMMRARSFKGSMAPGSRFAIFVSVSHIS